MIDTDLTPRQEIEYTKAITLLIRNEHPNASPEEQEQLRAEWEDHSYQYVMDARDYNRPENVRARRRKERAERKKERPNNASVPAIHGMSHFRITPCPHATKGG